MRSLGPKGLSGSVKNTDVLVAAYMDVFTAIPERAFGSRLRMSNT
jgi:hypothetical protein